jgi:hypothetical protein
VFAGLRMTAPGDIGGDQAGSIGDMGYIKYGTVTGYFLQDDPATDGGNFDYVRCPAPSCDIP